VRDIQTFETETFALFGTHKFLTPRTNYFEIHGYTSINKKPFLGSKITERRAYLIG
jgi:hypothetical protein